MTEKTYCVDVYSTVRHRFIVGADSERAAREKARAFVADGTDEDLVMALKDWDIDQTIAEEMEI